MKTQTMISIICLLGLSACIATPRIEIPNQMSFNHVIQNQQPMSYNDIMCCVDCHV
jgi:hypothetical protein